MQILPAIDLRGGQCVRLRQGDYDQETVFSRDPAAMGLRWKEEGAEYLHLVDLDGARDGQPANTDVVRRIVEATGLPCQLGGGIRSEENIREAIESAGVDRVIVGTRALQDPDWFASMSQMFPGRVALGIDARDSMVATEGWLETSQTSAIELAQRLAEAHPAAVIYTNIANDGMMNGVDDGTLADLRALCELQIPVIASGGVTTMQDVRNLLAIAADHSNLIGAIVGRAIYEGTISVRDACAATAD